MHNLSLLQAMDVWGDLVEAYHGVNGYGGNVAEVYCYRLQPHNPTADQVSDSTLCRDAARLRALNANRSLHSLIVLFLETYADARVKLYGRKFGPWLRRSDEDHRWHIEVSRNGRKA
jgi:hypothetical protein